MFGHWHYGGGFKARGDNSLGQGQVENVRHDLSQLPSTGPENAAWDAIGSSSLACINPAQCGEDIRSRECEGLVVCSGNSLGGCLLVVPVEASIEVIQLVEEGDVV